MEDIKKRLQKEEYTFLNDHPSLGKHVMLLGVSGSYGYGTNHEQSDLDLRGIAVNSKSDLLGMSVFEQYEDRNTDTVIYGFNKVIKLLMACNPNVIELLGLNPEHYLYLSPLGKELLDRKHLFLSKRAIQSFGGYADAQLRRLQNALARDSYPQQEKEMHILQSIRHAFEAFQCRYTSFEDGGIQLYLDESSREEYDKEIYMDISLTHYPLRDYRNIWEEMNHIVRDYDKIGKRNKKKDDNHLNKHAMHLIRLFLMALDILEQGEIRTYRKEEHELLMKIRNGEFQNEDGTFREEFYRILEEYERRLEYAAKHTELPDEPDGEAIEAFVMYVNERVVRDEL